MPVICRTVQIVVAFICLKQGATSAGSVSTCAMCYLLPLLVLPNTYSLVLGGTFYILFLYWISSLAICYLLPLLVLLITYSLVLVGTFYILFLYWKSSLVMCYLLPLLVLLITYYLFLSARWYILPLIVLSHITYHISHITPCKVLRPPACSFCCLFCHRKKYYFVYRIIHWYDFDTAIQRLYLSEFEFYFWRCE